MDFDKMKKWFDVAQQFHGKEFWGDVFQDNNYSQTEPNQTNHVEKAKQEPFPLVDIFSNDKTVVILIDVPGLKKEDVTLSIVENELHLKGKAPSLNPKYTIMKSERIHGQFSRVIALPARIDTSQAQTQFEDGLITIQFPRIQAEERQINFD